MDEPAEDPAAPVEGKSGIRPATFVITFVILSAVLIGPLFVLFSALRAGPFAKVSPTVPGVLIPPSGAYLGAFVSPRGAEDPKDAVQRLEAHIGRKLAIDHQYYTWNQAIPMLQQEWDASTGRLPFVDWSARESDGSPVTWNAIADGSQDDWIIQRAEAFKAFGSPIYLAFHHEPEDDLADWGTPADYAAAFRHIVSIFRSRGVTNVAFVWDMMNWTFDPGSGRDPNAFYPGDSYVDIIGIDGYDWYPGRAGALWESFQQIFHFPNDFAVAHGKPWMAVESGVQEDPQQPGRKGQWFRDVVATAKGWPLLKAVIYFDATKEYDWDADTSPTSAEGFAALGRDPYMSGGLTGGAPPDQTLRNELDLGPQGAPVLAGRASVGDPFSKVVTTTGSTLTYDTTHALGPFSAKHVLTSGGNAYYQWTGLRSIWYGRLYVWLGQRPPGGLRLIRGSANKALRCALDIMPDGTLRWVDQHNRPVIATATPLAWRTWVRIEWKVDHTTGQVTIKLFNDANSSEATQSVVSSSGIAIGPSTREIQYGRSGTQPFAFTLWTDEPGLTSNGYLGPA